MSKPKSLQAKLDIAIEALESIAAIDIVGLNIEAFFFGLSKDDLAKCACHDIAIAREALAKIEGEK